MKTLILTVCTILFTIVSNAQPEVISSLAKMEREFSDYASANGGPEAWTKYFAPDGIMFNPKPVNAIEFMKPRLGSKRPRINKLTWEACFTDVSSAGDLGYNIGPSVVENLVNDTVPKRYGYIFSIWRKVDETWRVALDAGVDVKDKTEDHQLTGKYQSPAISSAGEFNYTFIEADNLFAETAVKQSFLTAYVRNLNDESQMLRNEWALYKGKESILNWMKSPDKSDPDNAELTRIGSGESKSNDLAYTYGTYKALGSNEEGNYVHVWKRINGEWYLIFDVTGPIPK